MEPDKVTSVGMLGAGSVGAGWASLMLAKGLRVNAYDTGEGAEARARAFIARAWPSLRKLGVASAAEAPLDRLVFYPSLTDMVEASDVIQENAPEDPAMKRRLIAEADAVAPVGKIILSSTGGVPPTELQADCAHPERVVVFHPFVPAHLMPLVEIVPGLETSAETTAWAMGFARFLGKHPVQLNRESVGHMANRLQFALVREAVRCLLEGLATPSDIDAAVRYGLAPRWILTGGLMTLHMAGGAGGMRGILDHAGGAIEQWWRTGDPLCLTEDVRAALIAAGAELSSGAANDAWGAWRDDQLVPLLNIQSQADLSQPGLNGKASL
ncbi:3-hydroxyacyl-CoA dehydrogenase NAD-binding domain-containing protein [Salipiger sp. P9]|nr:3-hydroxyacyl-CoA dehydrogenase NAD-binding domain-containing protein [Salipiger pentaromativorans]